jgi:RimJ/RimL family protein N-acetyltransferase
MGGTWWPLTGLRLRTPALELRWPRLADLEALAALAATGVHDPGVMPFTNSWSDAPPAERALSTMRYHWAQWGAWQPADWTLQFAVVRDGEVVGVQSVGARDFAVLREVSTGSWLGLAYHRQGIGTQMRAAVLHLAFAGLGAEHAVSAAFEDNAASLGVSRRLGYRDDGIERHAVRGKAAQARRLRLTRADWAAARSVPVSVHGLRPCLPYLGVPPMAEAAVPAAARAPGPRVRRAGGVTQPRAARPSRSGMPTSKPCSIA